VIPLSNGVPLVLNAFPLVYTYVTYNSSQPGTEVSFTLSKFSSSVKMFVSSAALGPSRPLPSDNAGTYCLSYDTSATVGGPAVMGSNGVGKLTINPSDPCYCVAPCSYTVGLVSSYNAYYSVLAQENAQAQCTVLVDGVPQDSTITQGNIELFDFYFVPSVAQLSSSDPTTPYLTITVSQYFGSISLYALFDFPGYPTPSAATAMFSAKSAGGASVITLVKGDPLVQKYCGNASVTNPCIVHMGVAGNTNAAFSIQTRTNFGVVVADSRSQLGTVTPNNYAYYRFTHTDINAALIITVTGLSGPMDLFVSNLGSPSAPNNVLPTRAASTWRSISAGSSSNIVTQAVLITPADQLALNCASPCTYTIAVSPSLSATTNGTQLFSILARTRSWQSTSLLDGEPLVDYSYSGDYNYYSATLPLGAQSISIVASITISRASDVQIFARPDNSFLGITPGTFVYASPVVKQQGVDTQVTIMRTDPAVIAACGDGSYFNTSAGTLIMAPACNIQILVYTNLGSTYTITAVTGTRVLLDNVAVKSTIPSNAKFATLFFTYIATTSAPNVVATLVSVAGLAQGFLSTKDQFPTASTPNVIPFGGINSPTVVLDSINAACSGVGSASLCVYYFSILPYLPSTGVFFHFQASSAKSTSIVRGAVTGVTSPTRMAYYTYFVPGQLGQTTGGVVFQATAFTGGFMSFFINNMLDAYLQPIFPTPIAPSASNIVANGVMNSIWNVTGITSRIRIAIPSSDPNYRTATTYSIGVTSALPQTEFMISAYPINSSPLFEGGLPIYDIITSAGK
jgi:hypothetical protein